MTESDPILAAVERIERQLSGSLRIAEIARACYLSPVQLYRVFYSRTGHPVKEYVRRRRLTNALARLRHSGEPLAEIALEWGFSSQQAFCRAVKAATGRTPLEYRQDGEDYYFPRYRGDPGLLVTVAERTFPLAVRLQYAHGPAEGIENRAVGAFLDRCPDYGGRLFGRDLPAQGSYELRAEFRPGMLEALRGGPFTNFSAVPAGSAVCASTTAPAEAEAVRAAWDHLYNGWLPGSLFEPDDLPLMEEFHIASGAVRRMTLYLPVRKRSGYRRIRVVSAAPASFLAAARSGPRAEEDSARAVMDHVLLATPGLAGPDGTFLVMRDGEDCTCGVLCPADTPDPGGTVRAGVGRLDLPGGPCAVLECECRGDSATQTTVLAAWAEDNGFPSSDRPPYTLYRTSGDFGPRQVTAHVHLPLAAKDGKNG